MPDDHAADFHRLVLPAHLNHYGFLFGGVLLLWVDEASWIAASVDYPDCRWVTIAMDKVEFRHSVRKGTILNIRCREYQRGTTSVTYEVCVHDTRRPEIPAIFATHVTLVNLDENGNKTPIPNKAG
jgi:acyl-CoA hydrolase